MIRKMVGACDKAFIAKTDIIDAIEKNDTSFLTTHMVIARFCANLYMFRCFERDNRYMFVALRDCCCNWGGQLNKIDVIRYFDEAENVWVMDSLNDLGNFLAGGMWK